MIGSSAASTSALAISGTVRFFHEGRKYTRRRHSDSAVWHAVALDEGFEGGAKRLVNADRLVAR